MTKKQQMIDELMEGNTFAYPEEIRRKLNKRTALVIEYYFNAEYKRKGMRKEWVIQDIIRLG